MRDIVLAVLAIALFATATATIISPTYAVAESTTDKIAAEAERSQATADELGQWADRL